MTERRRRRRPALLPEPVPYYDHGGSQYPDRIRVSFADGHTEIYDRRLNQPRPDGYYNFPMRGKKT